MTSDSTQVLVLIGPPGAGCSSVGRAAGIAEGLPVLDLGRSVAKELGTTPDLALVAVPEVEYRRVETDTALRLLDRAAAEGAVVALGSGCLEAPRTRERLEDLRLGHDQTDQTLRAGTVVALTCSPRVLATRNGLNAPRSVALGTVHHQFVQMLRERQARCRELADVVVDTTSTTPEEACDEVIHTVKSGFSHCS